MACKFFTKLDARWEKGGRVCVGLDPDPEKVADIEGRDWVGDPDDIIAFNREIIDATSDIVLAYKPNAGFYTNTDDYVLHETLQYLREHAPDVPLIFDGKRGDIGNTNKGYVREAFDIYPGADEPGFDAITIHGYLGLEANRPFLDRQDQGVIVLCKTSNPGSGEFQDVMVDTGAHTIGKTFAPLYQLVAHQVATKWNYNGNCALVVGATYPEQLREVRKLVGDMTILIPGYGKQGGDLEASVRAGVNSKGRGFIINESSSAIFASMGPGFAQAARARVVQTTDLIDSVLMSL